jgi:biopolymer transport protein ExbB
MNSICIALHVYRIRHLRTIAFACLFAGSNAVVSFGQMPAAQLPGGPMQAGYQGTASTSIQQRTAFNNPQAQPNAGNFVPAPNALLAANPNNAASPANDGEANKEPSAPVRSLLQIFHDGGIIMYPIALCSFILTVFAFERFIYLRTGRVIPRPFVHRLIEQLQQQQIDRDEALELCERNPSPMAAILTAAVKRYGKSAVEIEQAVLDAGERETNQLRKYMRLLSAISNVAPLLGMLGTVLGMIQSFSDISGSAMGKSEMLAGGISTALLTTAFGLMVAIPAYLLYIYFLGRTDRLTMEMDSYAQKVVEIISAEGLQDSRARSRSRKAA